MGYVSVNKWYSYTSVSTFTFHKVREHPQVYQILWREFAGYVCGETAGLAANSGLFKIIATVVRSDEVIVGTLKIAKNKSDG